MITNSFSKIITYYDKKFNFSTYFKKTLCHFIDIIGSIDDLMEHNNKILGKINILKRLLYMKSISNSLNQDVLKEYMSIETGNMNLNENDPNGKYLFYTRNEVIFKANKYTHNQDGIIVAGEGNFTPKYASGKFGLHQRAYLLSSITKLFSNEILFQIISSNVDYLNSVAVGSTVKSLRKNSFENMPFFIDGNYKSIENHLKILQNYEQKYNVVSDKLIDLKKHFLHKFFG